MSDTIRFWRGAPESLALDILEKAVREAFRVARIPEAISQDAAIEGLRRKLINGILEYAKRAIGTRIALESGRFGTRFAASRTELSGPRHILHCMPSLNAKRMSPWNILAILRL